MRGVVFGRIQLVLASIVLIIGGTIFLKSTDLLNIILGVFVMFCSFIYLVLGTRLIDKYEEMVMDSD